ncbi:MAG TPA: heparinase II/III family protein [Phycisphaerae bacterium]|nr:heparinase II/III family protein [Phycisphaerae bacterium]
MVIRLRSVLVAMVVAWPALLVPPVLRAGDMPVGGVHVKILPPLPVWPSDYETITERRPTFHICGLSSATKYRVELARDAAFADGFTLTEFEITDTSGISPVVLVAYQGEPLPDGQYYWRAFCGDDEGFWTPPANYRTFFVSQTDRDAVVVPPDLAHPYLLVDASEIAALRERIGQSERLRRGWQYQVNAAHSALELEPVTEQYAKGGVGQHGNYSVSSGWYHRHLENVAFVAAVTGDKTLAAKGVEMLMTACSYERWLGPLFDDPKHFDPPWRSALETAMMVEAVAVGYDLLYPHLTDAQRQTVRQALADKGIRMLVREWADPIGSSQIPRHQTPTGNWVMVCSASAGLGALAILGAQPEAPHWTRLVRNRVRAWLHDRGGDWYVDNPWPVNRPKPIPVIGPSEPNFGRDGGYKESISYMNYGTRYVCDFANALRRVTGENLFTHVPENLLDHMAWSIIAWEESGAVKSAVVDFGDEGGTTSWYGDLLTCLMKNRNDGLAAWLYRRTTPVPGTPRILLWDDPGLREKEPQAGACIRAFQDIGQVVMRCGWGPYDPMAAIKFHQNRGHHDIGTFYLFGGGRPTIIDSGSANYNSPIYGSCLSRTVAHNVVMVDNENQVRADGELLAAVGTSLIGAASGQLKAAYPDKLESWTRDLVFTRHGLVVICDRLEGKGEHQFDLILHPENPFGMSGPNDLEIGRGPHKCLLQVLADMPLQAILQDGYHRTLPRKYVRFRAEKPASHVSFVTVCRWPTQVGSGFVVPHCVVRSLGPGSYQTVDEEGEESQAFWLSVTGADSGNKERLRSDARVAAAMPTGIRPSGREEVQDGAVVFLNGTYVNLRGAEVLRANHRLSGAVEWPHLKDAPQMIAQFWAERPTSVTLAVDRGAQVKWVRLGGRPVDFKQHENLVSIALPEGRSELTIGSYPRLSPARTGIEDARYGTDLLHVRADVNVPAYQEGVRTRASSSWTDGVDALDGDVNTSWVSLPGLPMPQWLEVRLPQPTGMTEMEIRTPLPTAGRVESWDMGANEWRLLGPFETTADQPAATVVFSRILTDRFRAVVERIDPANQSAIIAEWRWSAAVSRR